MACPFGASRPKPKPGEVEKETDQWSVQLQFTNDADCQLFQQKANEFDEFMIDEGCKPDNCVNWLGGSKAKPMSREVISEAKYSRMVKYSKDKETGEPSTKYPPFIRANLPTSFKQPYEFTCEIYDKNNKLLTASPNKASPDSIDKVITPGCSCSALLTSSIWCNNTTGFGVTWRVQQIKIFPPKGSIPKGVCFLTGDPEDEDEDEDEDEESAKEEKEKEKEEEVVEEETEEVIEEDDAEVVTEAPAPTPTKKVIQKK